MENFILKFGGLYLEIGVNIFTLTVVRCCLEVSVGATPRVGKASEDAVNPSVRADPPLPGEGVICPREGVSPRAPPPSWASAEILSPGTPRADVWGGRGTVVLPRGVGGRTVEPVPTGAY